jgi:hypothetical protein
LPNKLSGRIGSVRPGVEPRGNVGGFGDPPGPVDWRSWSGSGKRGGDGWRDGFDGRHDDLDRHHGDFDWHDDWDGCHDQDWYWWHGGYHDVWRYCDDWSWWSFSFGGWSSHFSFSFCFGGCGAYCNHVQLWVPWCGYTIVPRACAVTYWRPWYGYAGCWYDVYDTWWGGYASYATWTEPVVAPPLPSIDRAWEHLRLGDIVSAHDAFAALADAVPSAGESRIGLAIAAGLLADDDVAATEMRRALREDPAALGDVPRDLVLRHRIRILLAHYETLVRRSFADPNALFMVAALHALIEEHALAYFAIDAAIDAGEVDDAAFNLRDAMQAMLRGRLGGDESPGPDSGIP